MDNTALKINIAGTEYPCRITMGAMVRYKNEAGKDISTLAATDLAGMVLFLYCCTKSASNADNITFELDFQTFADHLDPAQVVAFYESMNNDEKKTDSPQTAQK